MTRYRAFGLVLSLMCLLAAPRSFAGSSSKDKDAKKTEATKQSTPPPKSSKPAATTTPSHSGTPSHSAGANGDSTQGHSSHGTSSGHSSSGTSASTGASNSAHGAHGTSSSSDHAHSAHGTSSSSDHVHGVHGTSSSSNQAHGVHDRSGVNRSGPVNRTKFHETMARHPGTQERQHSLERSRVEHARFQGHASPLRFRRADTFQLTHIRIVPTTYYYRRTVFYDAYGWQPSVYVYGLSPRYGIWDATFLAFALDHIAEEQYAMMLYNHQHDAAVQQWMQDSDGLAADNEDLRAKLDAMKVEMARLQESGAEADASYVPPDAQDVALSPEVITQLTAAK